MPGVTMVGAGPRHSRSRATSQGGCHDPVETGVGRQVGQRFHLVGQRATHADPGEFRFIEAGQHRHPDHERSAVGLTRRAAAASSIARPPAAWTVSIQVPRRVAACTAAATTVGMSWY